MLSPSDQPSVATNRYVLRWEVGDVFAFPTGLVLCVGATHTFAYFVTAEGIPLADVQVLDVGKDMYFQCNVGLRYDFQSRAQLQQDFQTGIFSPYFNGL